MPRIARSARHAPGALVHVISRFVDGRFVLDDRGREHYLGLLACALSVTDWSLVSYALMSSHVHLALLQGVPELSTWIHSLHVRFAQWTNRQLRRTRPGALGPVFAERPTSKVMCPSRARHLIAYHHRNPLRAGVVEDPLASSWTSHRAYMGLAAPQGGLDLRLGFRLAGFDMTATGRGEFHQFVTGGEVAQSDLTPIDGAPVLAAPSARVPSLDPDIVLRHVAAVVGQSIASLRGSRSGYAVSARRVALVVWLEQGRPVRQMADALQITRSGASRLLSRAHDVAMVRRLSADVLASLRAAGVQGLA